MKFDYLREFVVAARAKEMQQAAGELGISPSVLSKHMKAIEQELGVPLFTRARKTELSPYGKILLPYAEELSKVQDDYLQDFSRKSEEMAPTLIVGLSPIQFRERSGQLVEQFVLKHPQEVQIKEADNSSLCQMVLDEQIDIAFVRTQPELCRHSELMYVPFCTDPMVAFLPPDHPLADRPRVTIEDLKDEHILLRSENSAVYRVYTKKCEELGIVPHITFHSSYVGYDMVRKGEGVSLYLAPPVRAKRNKQQFVVVPVYPGVVSYVDVVFRPRRLSALGIELIQKVQKSAIEWYQISDL